MTTIGDPDVEMSTNDKGIGVNAASPKLSSFQSELYSSWVLWCNAKFCLAKVTNESTMVDYSVHVIPDNILIHLWLGSIYKNPNLWLALNDRLKTLLGDPGS